MDCLHNPTNGIPPIVASHPLPAPQCSVGWPFKYLFFQELQKMFWQRQLNPFHVVEFQTGAILMLIQVGWRKNSSPSTTTVHSHHHLQSRLASAGAKFLSFTARIVRISCTWCYDYERPRRPSFDMGKVMGEPGYVPPPQKRRGPGSQILSRSRVSNLVKNSVF